jgi:hypothetical protein
VAFNKELFIGATWDIHLIRILFWRRIFSVHGVAIFVLSLLAGIRAGYLHRKDTTGLTDISHCSGLA